MKRTIILLLMLLNISAYSQDACIGEIRVFAGNFAPRGWYFCNGAQLDINQNDVLYSRIGTTFGGDGISNFKLPNLNGNVGIGAGQGSGLSFFAIGQAGGQENITLTLANMPLHDHFMATAVSQGAGNVDNPASGVPAATVANAYSATSNSAMANGSFSITSLSGSGNNIPFSTMQPSLTLNYIICYEGLYNGFDQPFLGEVRMLAFNVNLPNNCIPCDGRLLNINQNQALFSLLGIAYGGDGINTFAVPDLRGRVPLGQGNSKAEGEKGGTETETLTINNLPAHTHSVTGATTKVFSGIGDSNTPVDKYPAIQPQKGNEYSSTGGSSNLTIGNTSSIGSSQPISNVQPYTTIQYVIITSGIFPSRN